MNAFQQEASTTSQLSTGSDSKSIEPRTSSKITPKSIFRKAKNKGRYFALSLWNLCHCCRDGELHLASEGDDITPVTLRSPTTPLIVQSPKLALMNGVKEKKTLILEIDQVLLFASGTKSPHASISIQALIGGSEPKNREFYLYFRPGLESFLESAAAICEVMVYTSGNKKFYESLTEVIDKNKRVSKWLFRDDCVEEGGMVYKDLKKTNRDLKKIIFVQSKDNSPLLQSENCIQIDPYMGQRKDDEFSKILKILRILNNADDIRNHPQLKIQAQNSRSHSPQKPSETPLLKLPTLNEQPEQENLSETTCRSPVELASPNRVSLTHSPKKKNSASLSIKTMPSVDEEGTN